MDLVTSTLPVATYAFYAKATDPASGLSACSSLSLAYQLISVTHLGWLDIKALGPTTVHADSGLTPSGASVTLTWNAVTVSSGSVSSYNLYRSTTSGGQDYTSPIATGIATGARTYTDNTVIAGTTYYYTIAPVVSTSPVRNTASADAEVKIIVPPDNMVLVHRWIANQEMCGLMGRTVDRTNNYRCAYTGPSGTGTYYDVGRSNFVDAYELGCNYTPAPGCGSATNGCLGNLGGGMTPPAAGIGNVGDVFYDRDLGVCWVKTAAATWTHADSAGLPSASLALAVSSKRGLPPLVQISQVHAYGACQTLTAPGFPGSKKLLTHQQQIIAGAWSPALSDAAIATIENGTSLNTTGYCNSNSGSGLTYQNSVKPTDMDTVSASAAFWATVRTGSIATRNCVSRYGVQDLIGNVFEWSSDQLTTCSNTTHTCTGGTSSLDPTNTDWNGFDFNGSIGPGGGSANVTSWNFSAMSFSATQFQVPLGLPMVASAPSLFDFLAIGTGAGQFDPAKFHGNSFTLTSDSSPGSARGAYAGGSTNSGAQAGRFYLDLSMVSIGNWGLVGARCALQAE